ncbi:MAG: NUDIX domain-containing protein [Alphaproteobacteria bacterium]|nr:NUDIX domain-containing protein [Alphaproteobacteria bacterium]
MTFSTIPKSKYFMMPVAVHLILQQKEDVLLLLRQGTGFCDGRYSVIAGHLDGGESATEAMIREAKEEAGIDISPSDLEFSCVLHRYSPDRESIDLFYLCKIWRGEIRNMEPHKCGELHFFPINTLPENMVEYVRDGVQKSVKRQPYSEFGWENNNVKTAI